MGEGDIEICLLCGIYLGFINTFLMLLLSFIIGGVVGVLLILFKVKGRKDYIPFGPFISLATAIVVLFGDLIFNWYISLF
ncbi:MAG: prepilin peptidase type [Caloramator sp.]|jgi:leader peptidase (prepilin peptidase)/N-methyltransferase|nr:prepilin peptidase type [Caloramator sp.]